jgi:hypothetical protein
LALFEEYAFYAFYAAVLYETMDQAVFDQQRVVRPGRKMRARRAQVWDSIQMIQFEVKPLRAT